MEKDLKGTLSAFAQTFTTKLVEAVHSTIEVVAEEVSGELADALGELPFSVLAEMAAGGGAPARGRRAASGRSGRKPGRKAGRKAAGGRLPRRSVEEIEAVVDKVASVVKRNKNGMRAEEIRAALDMDVRELPRVIKAALAGKKIKVLSGQKRSTTYGAGGGARATKPAKRSARKAAKKASPRKAAKKAKAKPVKAASKKAAKKAKVPASKAAVNGAASTTVASDTAST